MDNLKISNKNTVNKVRTAFKETKYARFELRIAYLRTKGSRYHQSQELNITESSVVWVTVWGLCL